MENFVVRGAWKKQYEDGFDFDYDHPNDAQNDAARGVMEAIYAIYMLKIYLVAEVLTK